MVILQVMQNNYMRHAKTKTKTENNQKFILPNDLIKAFLVPKSVETVSNLKPI
jgi:hypothetical protein